MKRHLSAWIQPFSFSDSQRSELLRVLPRRSTKDREAANCFVDGTQREVEIWLSLDIKVLNTSPSQHKEKLERLQNASAELLAAISDIPADTGAILHAIVITRLLCDPYKREHYRIANKLKQLGLYDPLDNDFFEELICLVEKSAIQMISNLKVRSGVHNGLMIGLTAKLADRYSECFQKEPTSGNGSNFRKFMSELSCILGESDWQLTESFGAQTVRDALERRSEIRKQSLQTSTEE